MSRCKHGVVLDEPWSGVGEVAAGVTGNASARREQVAIWTR